MTGSGGGEARAELASSIFLGLMFCDGCFVMDILWCWRERELSEQGWVWGYYDLDHVGCRTGILFALTG